MKNRWLNLLFILISILLFSLSWHLFVFAKTTAATSLIINILKPLSILLLTVLFYIFFRQIFEIYLGRRANKPGFRLQTKLVLGILPLTLVPSIFLFLLATRFVDDMVIDIVQDSFESEIIEASEALRSDYLEEIGRLQLAHGAPLLPLLAQGNADQINSYLAKHGLQGVEYFLDGQFVARYTTDAYPENRLSRLEDTADWQQPQRVIHFDDGFLLARFPFEAGDPGGSNASRIFFVFAKESPFSERFLFVQDSFAYLKHTERKTDRVKDINQGMLLVATLGVLFGGVWIGTAFARRFLKAFQVLISGAERVSEGRFDTQLELKTGDELEDVVQAFNSMTTELKTKQNELQQKAEDLENLNTELSDQSEYSHTILQQITTGILSTDKEGKVTTYNPAASMILELDQDPVGKAFSEILQAEGHRPLQELWQDYAQGEQATQFRELELQGAETTRYLTCSIVALRKEGKSFGTLIVLEDLTQLLQAQKIAAWQEVARRIAHEIKNPLTPIQLSIQRIRRKAEKDAPDLAQAIESAHETIMSETNLLKNLVNEFSTFAKMPAPVKTDMDLIEIAENVTNAYKPALPHIELRVKRETDQVRIFADPGQIRQVLNNLIRNAASASEPGGQVDICISMDQKEAVLEICDQGHGIPEQEREKIFVPYYSKDPKGTGLGLAIVKRIVQDHGGQIQVEENRPKGTRFIIRLPLTVQDPLPTRIAAVSGRK